MKHCLLVFLAASMSLLAEPIASITEMGEVPEAGVYDPSGWLGSEKRAGLEENFRQTFEKWELKVFVVILPEKPAQEVEVFCRELGQKWGGENSWGMLLHVIGDSESPWCAAERGESLRWVEEGEFSKALEGAVNRARLESAPELRVMVGVRELTDDLGFLRIVSNRRARIPGQSATQDAPSDSLENSKKWFQTPVWWIAIPLSLLLIALAMMGLKSKKERKFQGFHFPQTAPRRRFGGPWSGGGNVLVRFSDEKRREDWD